MILVLGGTSDSLSLAQVLEENGYDYMLSVATSYGKALASRKAARVIEGRMDQAAMETFLIKKQIQMILDATHPYAVEVSKNAMEAAKKLNLSYLRYERPSLLTHVQGEGIHIVESNEEACEVANKIGKNIFLGTGSKTLGEFVTGLKDKKIVARVLPTSEVILQCEALGLSPDNIIGMKGPFSEAINVALYRHYGIDCMITKESGSEGGFLEKVEACQKEGIAVIVIKRKGLDYPDTAGTMKEVLNKLKGLKSI